jgi:hypothetical protein
MGNSSFLSNAGSDEVIKTPRSAPTIKMLSDRFSSINLPALQTALDDLPASRPDVLDRARALIADPDYPSPDILSALCMHLASALIPPQL